MSLPWRVANTRDEAAGGPLTRALEDEGLVVVPCPVLQQAAAPDAAGLRAAVGALDQYDWVVVSSARSVGGLQGAGLRRWPARVRTAAVGASTARALTALGAAAPIVGDGDGADTLWAALQRADDWGRRRVLVTTTAGGRTLLEDRLRDAGAAVETLEVYAMTARPEAAIRGDWAGARADAAVVTSSRAATVLAAAVGAPTLARLAALVAIGSSTAATLRALGLDAHVPARADVTAVAQVVAALAGKAARR